MIFESILLCQNLSFLIHKREGKAEFHTQTLKKAIEVIKTEEEKEEEKIRALYAELWKDSNLLDAEMEELINGLAGALKEVAKLANGTATTLEELEKVEYLKTVNGHITKFKKKMPESHKRDLLYYGLVSGTMPKPSDPTDMVEKCKKLHQENMDFLKQIRLEIELHYTFKSLDFQESGSITKMLMKKWMHAAAKYQYKPLLDINDEARKLHMDIVAVLKSPLVNGQNLAKFLSEEAENAKSDGNHEAEGILTWGKNYLVSTISSISGTVLDSTYRKLPEFIWRKNIHDEIGGIEKADLESLFFMCDAVHSVLLKLPANWLEEKNIRDKIRDKLEMPMEWYSKMHEKAYSNIQGKYEPTEEMVHLRVELLLAKTLLVFERLDKFYRINSIYKMWKAKKMSEQMPHTLMKTYFDEFEQKKLLKHIYPYIFIFIFFTFR